MIYLKTLAIKYAFELSAGATGSVTTLVIDWNHIAGRAVETTIIAGANGAAAALAGYIALRIFKWLFPERKQNG